MIVCLGRGMLATESLLVFAVIVVPYLLRAMWVTERGSWWASCYTCPQSGINL